MRVIWVTPRTGSNAGRGALLDRRADLDPHGYLRWVERWVTAGASIVGGCCEIGPAHIRAIADRFG